MGGDLVDLVQGSNKWIGYLADVSGHGVPSGVLMAMVKSAVRMRITTSSEPQVLLEDLNRVISELIAAEMFVTLAFVSLGKSNDLYFEPQYEDFRPRTIWSLSNAFTSAFKDLEPIPLFKATAKLGEFLECRFPQSF
jgi:hypothetical protein